MLRLLGLLSVLFCLEAHAATLDISGPGALTFTLGTNESGELTGTGNSLTFVATGAITRTGSGSEFPGGGMTSSGDFVAAAITSITIAGGTGNETFTINSLGNAIPALTVIPTINTLELAGTIRTSSGAIALSPFAITVTLNTVLDTTANGTLGAGANVTLGTSVNGPSDGSNRSLAITAGLGDVALRNVGNALALASLSVGCAHLTLQGEVHTAGGDVDFTGVTQRLTMVNAVNVFTDELGGAGAAGDVRFGTAPLDASPGGLGFDLSIDARADGGGTSGDVTLGGVGASTGPTDLTVFANDLTLSAAVTTSGSQRYVSDTVALGGALSTTTPGHTLTLEPADAAAVISLGDPGSAPYHLSAAEVALLASSATPWSEIILGTLGRSGDITVAASGVSFAQSTTLLATGPSGDIGLSGTVQSAGTFYAHAGGTLSTAAISAPTGSVKLESNGLTQTAPLDVQSLLVLGSGNAVLTSANSVDTLAASVSGAFTFEQAAGAALTIGSVLGTDGVIASGEISLNATNGGPVSVLQDVRGDGDPVTIVGRGTGSIGLDVSAQISSVGSVVYGPLVLTGTGTDIGVRMRGATIATANTIAITGTGGTEGVVLDALVAMGTSIDSNSGALQITGTPSVSIPSATVSANGGLTISSDEIELGADGALDGSGALVLQPLSSSLAVEVGGAAANAALNLSATELSRVSDGFSAITISGDSVSINGATTFTDPVGFQASTTVSVGAALSGVTFSFDAQELQLASAITAAQALTIDPPAALLMASTLTAPSVRFMTALDLATHTLSVDGALRLGTTMHTTITGPTSYGAIDLTGTLNLNDTPVLTTNVAYANAATDRFTLITNDGSEPVSGNFAGLPELATIPTTSLKITYKIFANDVQLVQPATPTDLTLSDTSLAEGLPVGTAIGVLSSTDADSGDVHTYLLAPGPGADDNALFTISGDTLLSAAVFTFATRSLFSIRVRSTDLFGGFVEKTFAIKVDNPAGNQPPIFTNDPPVSASTRTPLVGDIVTFGAEASDIDHDDLTFSWSYGDGATDPTGAHAYAAAGSYTVTVTVSDGTHAVNASTVITVADSTTLGPPPSTGPTGETAPEPEPTPQTERGCGCRGTPLDGSFATLLLALFLALRRRANVRP